MEEASETRQDLNSLLSRAQMKLRKWRTNYDSLLQTVPPDIREKENLQAISPPDQCHKALGIHWGTVKYSLHVATLTLQDENLPTKRKIASDVARTFDLMGWSLTLLKVFIRKLGLDWDEQVPFRSCRTGETGGRNFTSLPRRLSLAITKNGHAAPASQVQ